MSDIFQALDNYNKAWYDLDVEERFDVKEKYVKHIDESNICMEVKLEVMKTVDDDMRLVPTYVNDSV